MIEQVSASILASKKQQLRAEVMPRRRIAHLAFQDIAAERLRQNIETNVPLKKSQVIGCYFPRNTEIDTRPLMQSLHDAGHKLALPVIVASGEPLVFRRWEPNEILEESAFGTMEPVSRAKKVTPSVLFVPLIAFDRRGYRVGYGGGYYDRTIAELRDQGELTCIGLAYATQEAKVVPNGASDQPMDWIITEAMALNIRHPAS